ncbi:MAG: ATP-binding protein [Armatimonadota bacterium]
MKQGEVVELEIPSAPEYVAVVRCAVEGIARRMCFDPDQIEDLKIAVGEACTNAIKYGCPRGDFNNVDIRCIVCEGGLLVEVRNSVAGCFRPEVPARPDLRREGGLGLYLIRHLMDEVDFEWDQNVAVVKMLKRL